MAQKSECLVMLVILRARGSAIRKVRLTMRHARIVASQTFLALTTGIISVQEAIRAYGSPASKIICVVASRVWLTRQCGNQAIGPKLKLDVGDRLSLHDPVEFDCPFCGLSATCGSGFNDEDRESVLIVAHEMPPCPQYTRLKPEAYLQVCIQEKKKHEPN